MQATLTDLENFQAAVERIAPDAVINTDYHVYICVEIQKPTCAFALYALTNMFTKLARAHHLHFDGFGEIGACFINEGDL